MNYSKAIILALSAGFLAGCGKSHDGTGQTVVKSPEEFSEILFENDHALVSKVTLNPGEQQAEHDKPVRLIYSLTDYRLDWREAGVSLGIRNWNQGDVHYHRAGKHSGINAGNSVAEWLIFAKKPGAVAPAGSPADGPNLATAAGEAAKVLFDNPSFTAVKLSVKPGETIPAHASPNRILYAISDCKLRLTKGGEVVSEDDFQAGDFDWRDAGPHAMENTGTGTAEILIVQFH